MFGSRFGVAFFIFKAREALYSKIVTLEPLLLLIAGGGLALGAFVVASLLSRTPSRPADPLLALLIGALALNTVHPVLATLLSLPRNPGQLFEPMEFLVPPLLAAYSRAIVQGTFVFRRRQVLHFLPFLAAVAATSMLPRGGETAPLLSVVFWALLSLQMALYLLPALHRFHRHRLRMADEVSNLAFDLGWLRTFFGVAAGLCVLWLLVLLALLHNLRPANLSGGLSLVLLAAIGVLGFRGLNQKTLTSPTLERSTVPPGEAERIRGALEDLFRTTKPHLNPDLDLAGLAGLLGVARNTLSFVINSEFRLNFYDLVNGRRVEEFRRLAADPSRREDKLLTLAFDAGFNSKATFNKAVLKLTGETPSSLRKREIESQPTR